MKKLTSTEPVNLLEGNYGLLNHGVNRVVTDTMVSPVYRETYQCLIVRSKVSENGDIYEETELVSPSSIKHPLDGIVYDPATMSMTAQLAAGVEFKEAHLGNMFSDPLAAERLALSMNSKIQQFVKDSTPESESTPEPVSTPESEPTPEPYPSKTV